MGGITFELAKELKDAGFPQHLELKVYGHHEYECFGGACIPTLSELIDSCGEGELVLNVIDGKYTNARIIGLELNGEGLTPEEAVARCWLALNKK